MNDCTIVVIWVMKISFVYLSVFLPTLPSIFCYRLVHTISVLFCDHLCMKYSLFALFLCIDHWRSLSCCSLLFFGTLHSKITDIHWIIEKVRDLQKNSYFYCIDYSKAFDCVDHYKLWKSLKEMGILDHLIYLLRNLYAGQEAKIRTRHGKTDWF